MNLLELVQSLHHEAKQPGSPPASVEGQTGRAADLVRWAKEAYNDIQREKAGRWKWLLRDFTLDTSASDNSYTYDECTDVDASTAIDRFRAWHIHRDEPPRIYLVSDGQATEANLAISGWSIFREMYLRGSHEPAYPTVLSVSPKDVLFLGPKPNGIYRVSGSFWRSNQQLVVNDDVPEMPEDYHMLIVYRAIVKYAFNIVGHEILARAQAEGQPLYDALATNQSYAMFSLRLADALA